MSKEFKFANAKWFDNWCKYVFPEEFYRRLHKKLWNSGEVKKWNGLSCREVINLIIDEIEANEMTKGHYPFYAKNREEKCEFCDGSGWKVYGLPVGDGLNLLPRPCKCNPHGAEQPPIEPTFNLEDDE
jgi:hypothetical protein